MTIAFIGLGNMGTPMVRNLISAGYSLHIYNRSPEKMKAFENSARTFNNSEEAVKDVDVVITMLSDDHAVQEVTERIVPLLSPGTVHISMSTISPATATRLADTFHSVRCHYVAAPVMGRPAAAEAKQLYILCSGKEDARKKVQPILQELGQNVFDFGDDPSSANVVKLIANYLIFATIEMFSEVLLLAEKRGIDKNMVLDTLTSTIFAAPIFKLYGSLLVEEKEIPNGFATRLASKDLRLMLETAKASGAYLPIGEVVQKHFKEMIANDGGEKDVSMLISHLRKGVQ